jgi:putative transposase
MFKYPERPHHETPTWVNDGALFHVRMRVAKGQRIELTSHELTSGLLKTVVDHHMAGRWWCELFLLMPDHLHALLRFPRHPGMAVVVRNWKRGAARLQGVRWQDNFFDHRIRSESEARDKWLYIRLNPVVKGLCTSEEDWPHWWSPTEEAR